MAKRRNPKTGGRGRRGGAAKAAPTRRFVFNEQLDFKVPPSCNSDDPEVNRLNKSLADYYGSMAICRANVYALLVEELEDRNVGVKQAEARYLSMKVIAKRMITEITSRNHKAVPFPPHFNHAVKL